MKELLMQQLVNALPCGSRWKASARVIVGLVLWRMRMLGEATRKVKSHIGVQLQSSSFFDHLKGVQP